MARTALPGFKKGVLPCLLATAQAMVNPALDAMHVQTPHSYTGRMCAASRWEESQRPDSLFQDPLAYKLAGQEGRRQPMGSWIMVPRTRYGDDLMHRWYKEKGCRQLVLLGAGMDSRAYRMQLPELRVYEVDQQTTFDVKEPLLADEQLTVATREAIGTDFSDPAEWAERLLSSPTFQIEEPTVWLLEGLMMYLQPLECVSLMKNMGNLSGKGSVVFHDAISASYVNQRIVVGGAPFVSGHDDFVSLWSHRGGFSNMKNSFVLDFQQGVYVDRGNRKLHLSGAYATPQTCRGRHLVLFVQVEK